MALRFAASCCVVLSACNIQQSVEQASRNMLNGAADELGRAIVRSHERQAQQPAQPQQQSPAQPQQAAMAQPASTAATAPAARHTSALFAVLDFKNRVKGKDAESVDAVYFANQVRSAVKRAAPQAKVMTRENVLVLLESQGKSLSDCEGECEVDTGRRLGADMVVSGDLLKIGGTWKLDLRLHQTSDGSLISGAAASGRSPDDLDEAATRAVAELLAPLP